MKPFTIKYNNSDIDVLPFEKGGITHYQVGLPQPVTLRLNVVNHMSLWIIERGYHEDPNGLGEAISNREEGK